VKIPNIGKPREHPHQSDGQKQLYTNARSA
jgi:hypothetical protein